MRHVKRQPRVIQLEMCMKLTWVEIYLLFEAGSLRQQKTRSDARKT